MLHRKRFLQYSNYQKNRYCKDCHFPINNLKEYKKRCDSCYYNSLQKRYCIECRKPINDLEEYKRSCNECFFNYYEKKKIRSSYEKTINNYPNNYNEYFSHDIEEDYFDTNIFSNKSKSEKIKKENNSDVEKLDKDLNNLSLEEDDNIEIKIKCVICECFFEVNKEEKRWKKKCMYCFLVKNLIFKEMNIAFFEDLFNIENLKSEEDFSIRLKLIQKLANKKEFFKLEIIDYTKFKFVENLITEFLKKFEEKNLLLDVERKYLINTKEHLI